MPTNKTITPLIGGNYYHIYNRGINRGQIFFQQRNYDYFLFLWNKYISDGVEVLAYCLLPNHFHFLIKLTESITVQNVNGETEIVKDEAKIGEVVSEKLRRLFISFSQAINKQECRTGSLVNRNFKRILIDDDEHLKYLFFYIHYNPVKHGLTSDLKNYRYSSYKAYVLAQPSKIAKNHGLELFDGVEGFLSFHNYFHEEKENLELE